MPHARGAMRRNSHAIGGKSTGVKCQNNCQSRAPVSLPCYVDDLGVHGATKLQVETRARVLEAILTVMEKPFSDKTGDDVWTLLDI